RLPIVSQGTSPGILGDKTCMRMRKTVSVAALVTVVSTFIFTAAFAGSIIGHVTFADDPPPMPAVKVSKDQDYCGETLPNETYLIGSDGGLQNVVVFIETSPSRAEGDPQKDNILNNTACRYSPRIQALQKGERLRVKNNDPKLHIPHSYHEER